MSQHDASERLGEALETLGRIQSRSTLGSGIRQDIEVYATCLRAATPDELTAADLIRGIAWLVEHHPPEALAHELRRVARNP